MNNISKSIASLWPAVRISLVLILITTSIMLVSDLFGFAPNKSRLELEARKQLSESLAIQFSVLVADQNLLVVRKILSKIVQRENDIVSAGFRNKAGILVFQVGPHQSYWGENHKKESTTSHVIIPIFKGNIAWGSIELGFKPLASEVASDFFNRSIYKMALFVFVFGFFCFLFFILRTLRQIDPSSVIPERVNAAFDTLSEGVLILDQKQQIVLANTTFAKWLGRTSASLMGFKISELDWKNQDEDIGDVLYPWIISMQNETNVVGEMMMLGIPAKETRTLVVNSAAIMDNNGKLQGVLLTFDDVTDLEEQKVQLQEMVSDLEVSQKEVQRKNKELHFLATRDPLTGCLNRRSFNEQFVELFSKARTGKEELCCIMADIDHFKLVNDNYGHAVGDDVIKLLADILNSSTRDVDIVGRYGGEEFCVILPGLAIEEAISVAERMRIRIKADSEKSFESGPWITASLGVASIFDQAKDPAELNDQADQALYVAKESGRNRVVRWTADAKSHASLIKTSEDEKDQNNESSELPENSTNQEEIKQLRVQIKQLENAATDFSEKLQKEQHYDNLTGLPNKSLFYDRITQAIEQSTRHNHLTAVLIVDINLFSQVNKSFGRTIADQMFKQLSDRLGVIFRKTDSLTLITDRKDDLTISRFDGDEFGVLLPDLNDRLMITWVIQRIIDEMSIPVDFEGNQVFLSCKIGISIYPEDANTASELITHAQTAKHFAKKQQEQNNYQFYDAKMQQISVKQVKLEAEIRNAIKNQEWQLYYQPKMDMNTGQIHGVEALIRWSHPERGILTPYEFLDVAEQRGLIIQIGEWVLQEACNQAKKWVDQGYNLKVAVNLSALQLRQKNFSNKVLDVIQKTNIHPKYVELEVTETVLMDNIEQATNTLNRLHCRGILISIDDFGTGYSSLSYLKRLPIDAIKIDRSFVKDLTSDEHDKNIVKTIINMAHSMDLKVIAEGVETEEQFSLLQTMSCDVLQGYLLSKPVPADQINQIIQKKISLKAIKQSQPTEIDVVDNIS